MDDQALKEVKAKNRFVHAFRGLGIFLKTTRHLPIHVLASAFAVFLGWYFKISGFEWIAVIFSIGFVLVAEAVNTAIEIDINLTSPEYHPYARDTKDVAAGAVLISAITALTVGLIIFVPKVCLMIK